MKRYRVLIVDDEVNIVKGLTLLIERLIPECQVAGVAYDGISGSQVAMAMNPDIILTDIRMPEADGIEMIRCLKAAGHPARFIILSGYADFEYAQSAISMGVEGYIIKPVEETELCEVFSKVCRSLKAENERLRQFQKMKHTVNEYGLKEILEAGGDSPGHIRQKLSALDVSLTGERYLCTIWQKHHHSRNETDFPAALQKALESCLDFACPVPPVLMTQGSVAVIMVYDQDRENQVRAGIAKARGMIPGIPGTELSVGMGTSRRLPEQIPESFEEARCALNYQVLKGCGCIIRYEEISHLETSQTLVDDRDIKALEEYIDAMDDAGCRQAVDRIFDKIGQTDGISLSDLQILSLNLVLTGIRKIPFMQFQLNSYLGRNILSLESISRFQTVEQLKNWIINMLKSMNELMLKENLPKRQDIIAEIKLYINKNYNREISLNDIAERFYINPYYLSQLFKKRTGETYQKYLTGIRMNRAGKLLTETELKLYEIADLVGYSDANYFSKIFERHTGMKPNEYRGGVSKPSQGAAHDSEKQEHNYE